MMSTEFNTDLDDESVREIERFRQRMQLAHDDVRRLEVIQDFLPMLARIPELAIEYATEAHRIAMANGLRDVAADALRHRGHARWTSDDIRGAERDLREAHELAVNSTSDSARATWAQSALALGDIANTSGDVAAALQWYMSALDACDTLAGTTLKTRVFEALGHLYAGLGDYTRALEHHFETLALVEGSGDADTLGVTYAAIGTTYAMSGDDEQAYDYAMRALEAFRRSGNRYLEVQALSNLASILYSRGELATALEHSMTAIAIYEALDDRLHVAASLVTMGNIYERQGDLDSALHCYQRAMRALGDNVDERLHISILASVGNIYRVTAAFNEALFMFDQALRIAQEIEEPRYEYQLHESLSQVYEDLGLPAQALEHHKHFARLRNELAGQERQKAIAELQVRYEVDRAAREREVLRARAAELEAEMDRKQNELTALALNLVQKNELLDTLKAQIGALQKSGTASSEHLVERLMSEIDANRSSDANWKLFEQQLEMIHPDMLRKLSERFPSLTPTELKVCSLIAINLSTKDMANLLFTSVRTVETQRLNIRRKINLPKDTNLSTFLASIATSATSVEDGAST